MKLFDQYPEPGKHAIYYTGDTIEFRILGTQKLSGRAFISTNIGNANVHRQEIIDQTEKRITCSGADWVDLPMEQVDDYTFSIRLALSDPGHYEAKCSFIPEASDTPVWAEGDNVHINVEPAAYCASNGIYCAFVRQFGPNKCKSVSEYPGDLNRDELRKIDDYGFTLIPQSGTFRDLAREVEHVFHKLHCRIVHLLPVNPTPTVYARMGRFGSPYASLDFTGIDPAMAEFDKKATPLDQFGELVNTIHAHNGKLFIDIAINHTGWAAKLHETHPDWLVREADGSIHSPGAWGVTWGDLTELDHQKLELWQYLADVFITWCERGVDGFRCDAGYMIPIPAWEYIVARVRTAFPNTILLLEGLGGPLDVTRSLLNQANMNWAYSELFQNYSRQQVEGYLKFAWNVSISDGILVNYAETHDNNRLAATSHEYASMRTALAALTSCSGAFGFANGVEWFATEKIDVHEASGLNWGAEDNQVDLIARLNTLLSVHPAFFERSIQEIIPCGNSNAVMFIRSDKKTQHTVVVMVNLQCDRPAMMEWSPSYTQLFMGRQSIYDLISGRKVELLLSADGTFRFTLPAAQFVCLSTERQYLSTLEHTAQSRETLVQHLVHQFAKTMVLKTMVWKNKTNILPDKDCDIDALADLMLESPERFLAQLYDNEVVKRTITWHWPEDLHREVMIPPENSLLVVSPYMFRISLSLQEKTLIRLNSIPDKNGRFFVIIPGQFVPDTFCQVQLRIRVFNPADAHPGLEKQSSTLLLLPRDVKNAVTEFNRDTIYNRNRVFIQANGRGALIHQRMELEQIDSRYDAVLLANLSPNVPEDRHIMWRRNRIWLVWRTRRQELKHEYLQHFYIARDGGGVWQYSVPVGNGLFVSLTVKMFIVQGENTVCVAILRDDCRDGHCLAPQESIHILVRPDIEDRNFHCNTKASQGPEYHWPGKIVAGPRSFEFHAAEDRILFIQASAGTFRREDKWIYMCKMEQEEQRGLDPYGDMYSPGVFRAQLQGGDGFAIAGQILRSADDPMKLRYKSATERLTNIFEVEKCDSSVENIALKSLASFVVKRDNLKTVIAGYPWFLDWGRDTLIAARGLIAAPQFRSDVRDILLQFLKFEQDGTIPNMISGTNASNRDTTDAPLWLFTAVRDFCRAEKSNDFVDVTVRGTETVRDILQSLAAGFMKGTPNGIVCDDASGLVFSPSHFTWMDTNYPAGTPREGYPIEIQALWFAALDFLSEIAESAEKVTFYKDYAEKVRQSVLKYYTLKDKAYLSDCLHCTRGVPAEKAVADDHMRPNQLLAITLGLVDDKKTALTILDAIEILLVPGAIRSLADRDTEYALPVYSHTGQLLNNPNHPYFGHYQGDEDTSRKVAYHNGTAWTWQFPLYSEALYKILGGIGKTTAIAYLSSMTLLMDNGCVTQIPEIIDGDAPHASRGCDAQAWGMSEFYRVWKLLHATP